MSDDLVKRLQTHGDVLRYIEAQTAEIARLRAALATARREGMAEIKQDTDELIEQGRQDGMEQAAQIAEDFETVAYQHGNLPANDPHECAAQAAREIAAAIRAAAKEGKP